jgi:hypothetical protein
MPSDPSGSSHQDLLEQLRQRLGISENKPIIVGSLDAGKSAEERYREEMEFLHRAGANQSGQEQIRALFGRMGRLPDERRTGRG